MLLRELQLQVFSDPVTVTLSNNVPRIFEFDKGKNSPQRRNFKVRRAAAARLGLWAHRVGANRCQRPYDGIGRAERAKPFGLVWPLGPCSLSAAASSPARGGIQSRQCDVGAKHLEAVSRWKARRSLQMLCPYGRAAITLTPPSTRAMLCGRMQERWNLRWTWMARLAIG